MKAFNVFLTIRWSLPVLIINTSLNICHLIDMMKSISFLVEPSGLIQGHLLLASYLKKKFIIKSPFFFMKSAKSWPLWFRSPVQNLPISSSVPLCLPSLASESPINTVNWPLKLCMTLEIFSYIASTSSSGYNCMTFIEYLSVILSIRYLRHPGRHTFDLHNAVNEGFTGEELDTTLGLMVVFPVIEWVAGIQDGSVLIRSTDFGQSGKIPVQLLYKK